MSTTLTQETPSTEMLAIAGGKPCVVEKPESYLFGAQEIGKEEEEAVIAALRTKNLFRFFKDPKDSITAKFAAQFGEMTQVAHTLPVNSGTSALIAAMVGLGVSAGDEVIVPAYTFIATASAVLALRAFPVVAEIDNSLTLDPIDVEKTITPRTRAIVAVHMRGVSCRMDEIMAVAKKHNIKVLEDCAQSNGGSYKGRPLGSIGDAGAFSMQHFKIITAGEGGAVTTNDRKTFERAACYHDCAYAFWKSQDWLIEPFVGENYRMSEMNGALVMAQLQKRGRILARTRQIKKRMWAELADLKGVKFQDIPDREGDCGLSLVLFMENGERAKKFAEALRAEGMSAGSMFDQGIPDRHIYYHWDYIMKKRTPDLNGYPWNDPARPCQVEYSKDMCPQSLGHLNRAVSMPITQVMTDAHVESCIRAVRKVAAVL